MKDNILTIITLMIFQIGTISSASENHPTVEEIPRAPVYAPIWGEPPHWSMYGYAPVFLHPYPIWWGAPAPWTIDPAPWYEHGYPAPLPNAPGDDYLGDYDHDAGGSVFGEAVYAEDTEDEDGPNTEVAAAPPPAPINYERFLDFRNMTYDSPTSWAR
ncbi:MAG: hypothetical protein WCP46_09710 [Alphaproteobacteria bacterium]